MVEMVESLKDMKTEHTAAGDQGLINDVAVRRKVPTSAKQGGGDLKGLPMGEKESEQTELFKEEGK